jgi:hypothetical protein
MSVHAGSLLLADVLVVRYHNDKREVIHRHTPKIRAWDMVMQFNLSDFLDNGDMHAARTLKFLNSWANAIQHSNMSVNEKKEETAAVRELMQEIMWSVDWSEEAMDLIEEDMP